MFTYVVEHDFGFAPNPFFGVCTLATCKPQIRATAMVGDLILATGSKAHGRERHLVYFLFVDEILTYDSYWEDERFSRKRPQMSSSVMRGVGDNIYHHASNGSWMQEYSLHRRFGDTIDQEHLDRDTKSEKVLVGTDFAYWGGEGPEIPNALLEGHQKCLAGGRPIRSRFSDEQIADTISWLRSLNAHGFLGRPTDWDAIAR